MRDVIEKKQKAPPAPGVRKNRGRRPARALVRKNAYNEVQPIHL